MLRFSWPAWDAIREIWFLQQVRQSTMANRFLQQRKS
jgi:hypothetical protein